MEKLISSVARSLVDNPRDVEVNRQNDGNSALLELSVNEKDLGKVIGKQGRTIRAMRTLLTARSAKDGTQCRLEIVE